MCDLLARGASNREGKFELSIDMGVDPGVSKIVDFLLEQGWLEKGGDGIWTVTPAGRFWFESLQYGDVVRFHEYGGAVFLLNTRPNAAETIVWHKGGNGGAKLVHGSGGIVSLRAEQDSAT